MPEQTLLQKVESFPKQPGIYLMKNEKGEVLYVGKAINLRKRVSDYFSERDSRYQIQFLMRRVTEIETVVTHNEKEALLLENTFIKKHKPRYNIFLKDDKSYLSLKLTTNHDFPRLFPTRDVRKDGNLYFGPYTSAASARQMLDFLQRHFRLRDCKDHDFANRSRPCLQYQIKRCDAPCVGYISKENYAEWVRQVILFLQNRNMELVKLLKTKMNQASELLQYEEAARLRDLLNAIEVSSEKQQVVKHFEKDQDVIGFAREADRVSVVVMIYREGSLLETKNFLLKSLEEDQDLLESFILQFYQHSFQIPSSILIPNTLPSLESVEQILSERKSKVVHLLNPQKGEKLTTVQLASENAQLRLQNDFQKEENRKDLLLCLQETLHLSQFPERIECYDISNIQGTHPVGSCVCFVEGRAEKKFYRKFKIKTVHQANDFAMLYEVLSRRLKNTDWPYPNLIIIDGGKGQLNAAHAALKDAGISNIDLISLAKEKKSPQPPFTKGGRRGDLTKPERVFLLNRKDPLLFSTHAPELHLLMQVRDEAHRFAITFHRQLRGKSAVASSKKKKKTTKPTKS